MDKKYESEDQRLAQLTLENLRLSHRAKAMEKLIIGYNETNKLSLVKLLPKLSLRQYQQSINYQLDHSFKFNWL